MDQLIVVYSYNETLHGNEIGHTLHNVDESHKHIPVGKKADSKNIQNDPIDVWSENWQVR